MSEHPTTIREYADYACPFCYLSHRSLEEYRRTRDEPLVVDWRPYDLRSDSRDANGDIEGEMGYPEEVEQRIEQLRAEHDADEMLTPDTVPKVDTRDAQLVSLYVKNEHPDRWMALDSALFAALWEDGRDINDEDVLADVATSVGVDDDAVRDVLADDEYRERLAEQFADARHNGVTDVPTFVADGRTETGFLSADDLDAFVRDE
ncbi:DsbA family oxidoreductase [Halococcus thailandensis]|uniref:DSBA oxidoreductase n=1 Tax=Halococcus thailandensis JCM 13552 TaxID=1227457 RepID=M0N6T1_9EURY|nr:DsbA family protein [Halococcus thailandensis]EMA52395.1 DSBA oxidoreductase [Halococcus thailandensis JCM 13552]